MSRILSRICAWTILFSLLSACASTLHSSSNYPASMTLIDAERARSVPIQFYFPKNKDACTAKQRCPVAFFSAGYGLTNLDYSFIARSLTNIGYLVVSIQHQLPEDAPIKASGDIYKDRSPMWERGAKNIRFVKNYLSFRGMPYTEFNWQHPVLIGHSNGGDISAWLARESASFASAVITLDNRRVPLPRGISPKVLSMRASDFEADQGVLPTKEEQLQFGICIVKIDAAHHNDMYDGGSVELKNKITDAIEVFLRPSIGEGKKFTCSI